MLPALAVAGGAKVLGSVAGALGQNAMLNKGLNQYNEYVGKGTDQLRTGKSEAGAAYDPYKATGADAVSAQADLVNNRQMATQPTASNTDPNDVSAWLNPMATWQQNQATKAGTAAGIATGATGGGMQRALANNASKMAQGSWNDAYNQMLQANNQNFGQGQQLYENQTGFDQSQIDNQGRLADRGLTATGQEQQLQAGYNTGINENYGQQAANAQSVYGTKGQLWKDTTQSLGNQAGGLFNSILGGK
jgi:hypothetical protein